MLCPLPYTRHTALGSSSSQGLGTAGTGELQWGLQDSASVILAKMTFGPRPIPKELFKGENELGLTIHPGCPSIRDSAFLTLWQP